MSVGQGPVQFADIETYIKGEVILSDSRFAEVYQPKIGHFLFVDINTDNDLMKNIQLCTMCTKIDNVQATLSDIMSLKSTDFFKISSIINK